MQRGLEKKVCVNTDASLGIGCGMRMGEQGVRLPLFAKLDKETKPWPRRCGIVTGPELMIDAGQTAR